MTRRELFQAVRREMGGGNAEKICYWVNKQSKTNFTPSDFRKYFASDTDNEEIENACKKLVGWGKVKNSVIILDTEFTQQDARLVKKALHVLKRKGLQVTIWK